MSRMGQDFFDMQEDAISLTKEDFVKKYGANNADIYDKIWEDYEPPQEFLQE